MKIINQEYFIDFKKYGCRIEHMVYEFDYMHDCFILKIVIGAYEDTDSLKYHSKIELKMFSPSNIFMEGIENNNQICEIEMLDYYDDGYSSEIRYRLHDVENEQINVCFEKYTIKYLN